MVKKKQKQVRLSMKLLWGWLRDFELQEARKAAPQPTAAAFLYNVEDRLKSKA